MKINYNLCCTLADSVAKLCQAPRITQLLLARSQFREQRMRQACLPQK